VDWVGEADGTAKTELPARAACLLLPICWEEPFGLVMVEAMACGTPVVALRRGAVPEVVADGVTGIVCDDPPTCLRRSAGPASCARPVASGGRRILLHDARPTAARDGDG
jgi:glycosyltransferase involved in cell wall biosynthesis